MFDFLEPLAAAGEYKLFVGMLAQTTTEENLQQLFKAYGNVTSTAVLRHKYVLCHCVCLETCMGWLRVLMFAGTPARLAAAAL